MKFYFGFDIDPQTLRLIVQIIVAGGGLSALLTLLLG